MAQMLDFGDLRISDFNASLGEVVCDVQGCERRKHGNGTHRFSRYPYIDSDGGDGVRDFALERSVLAQQQVIARSLRHAEVVRPNMPV